MTCGAAAGLRLNNTRFHQNGSSTLSVRGMSPSARANTSLPALASLRPLFCFLRSLLFK